MFKSHDLVEFKMKKYNKGRLLIILATLVIIISSLYYIVWSRNIYLNGPLNLDDYHQLQGWFWFFTIFSGFNIFLLLYCKYKKIHLSLNGYYMISPFILVILTSFSMLNVFTSNNSLEYINEPLWIETYFGFLIIFEILFFIGVFIVNKDKNL